MRRLHLWFLAVGALGCGGDNPEFDTARVGQVQLAALGGSDHDVAQFEFRIVEDGTGDCTTGTVVATQMVPLEEEPLPPWIGAGPDHHFADGLFVLPAGSYLACALPLDAASAPSAECAPASASVVAVGGATTEIVLTSQCDGDANGGIDVVAMLNDPPSIDDLDIAPSKFIRLCEQADITLTASDIDGDPISYSWAVTGAPAMSNPSLTAMADQATFSTDAPGDYEVTVTVTDAHTATASLSFPIHVQDLPCSFLASAGGSGTDMATSIALDPSGNAIAYGHFDSASFDGAANAGPAGTRDLFVAKYDSGGNELWGNAYGSSGDDVATAVTTDAMGDVYIAGSFENGINFGCNGLQSAGGKDGFIVKLVGEDGSCVWSGSVGDSLDEQTTAVALDSNGDLFVGGWFDSPSITLPNTTTTFQNAGGRDAFYLKNNVQGSPMWERHVGGAGDDVIVALDISAQDAVVISGNVGTGGALIPDGVNGIVTPTDSHWVGVISSGAGFAQWVSASSSTDGTSVAFDGNGDIIVSGTFDGPASFGGNTVTPAVQSVDALVGKLGGTSGNQLWLVQGNVNGIVAPDMVQAIVTPTDNNVIVAPMYSGTIDFGGGVRPSIGQTGDLIIVELAGQNGTELSVIEQAADADAKVAVDTQRGVYAAGAFGIPGGGAATLSFAGLTTTGVADLDVFIGRIAP